MTVLYFGSYDPRYSRNAIMISSLRSRGIEVVEARTEISGIKKYWDLFWQHWRFRNDYDVMIVGFLGHAIIPFAKLITRKPVVFDAFISLYDSNVSDRKTVRAGTPRAGYYWMLDWLSMHCADAIVFDTNQHIEYARATFHVAKHKFHRIFVGTDPKLFYPRVRSAVTSEHRPFTVHFHGSGIPLQGINVIREAEALLKDSGIIFQIITNANRVPYEQLPELMAPTDVALGIFGSTAKTQRVIPNKVFEALAMKLPVITADTPAIRELFSDQDLVLIPVNNARALVDAITMLKSNSALRIALAEHGFRTFVEHATPNVLGSEVQKILQSV